MNHDIAAENRPGLIFEGDDADVPDVAGPGLRRSETIQFDILDGLTGSENAGVHGYDLWREVRNYFADGTADMGGGGKAIGGGENVVDPDIAQVTIDKAEADGSGIVDGVEFSQVLSGEGLTFLNGAFGAELVGDVAGEASDDGYVDTHGS